MRSGRKNTVVSIMQLGSSSRDPDYNTPNFTETAWKEDLFCYSAPKKGRELEIDGQIAFETYRIFEFDYYDVEGIAPEMVIVESGRRYDIRTILDDLDMRDWIRVEAVHRPIPTGGA